MKEWIITGVDLLPEIEVMVLNEVKNFFPNEYKSFVCDIWLKIESGNYGDFSLSIAKKISAEIKKDLPQVAEKIADSIKKSKLFEKVSVESNGFINIFLSKDFIFSHLENSGIVKKSLKGRKILIEYAQPNPYKVMHIGHLRNITIGESLVRIFEEAGAGVIRANYQGDVGMHIAKCLFEFQKIDQSDYPDDIDGKAELLGKCYSIGAKKFNEDDEARSEIAKINADIYSGGNEKITSLWKLGKEWSLEKFRNFYKRVGTYFHKEYFESEVFEDGLKNCIKAFELGILEKDGDAIIFRGEKYGLDTRVFINSEGFPTYEGKELGLAPKEANDFGKLDKIIHIVGKEQISFFKVTFKVQELLWPETFNNLQYHLPYGFVNLKEGKMSSRLGNVVLAEDLINDAKNSIKEIFQNSEKKPSEDEIERRSEKLAVASVKYAFLKNNTLKDMYYDKDSALSMNGDSGIYLLYTFARIKSILKKSDIKDFDKYIQNKGLKAFLEDELELSLARELIKFECYFFRALSEFLINNLTEFAFRICMFFNSFYTKLPVLKEESQEKKVARIYLLKKTSEVLEKVCYLLGFEVLDEI